MNLILLFDEFYFLLENFDDSNRGVKRQRRSSNASVESDAGSEDIDYSLLHDDPVENSNDSHTSNKTKSTEQSQE